MTDETRKGPAMPPRDAETRREFLTQVAATAAVPLVGHATGAAPSPIPGPQAQAPAGRAAAPAVVDVPARLRVNGRDYDLTLDPRATLLDALRERMGLTGTKKGCDHGACGACTVLVDGRRVNACLTLALAAQGKEVITIEGLAHGEDLHPMQAAFLEHDGYQCGYCTPGQICSAVGLLAEGVAADNAAIREGMAGNLCRCGAYANIVAAIRDVIDHRTA